MVNSENIKHWIESGLSASQVVFIDGDGHHFEAVVVCEAFAGKNRLERHRLVYAALGQRMQSEIHALSLKTLTPDEYNIK